SGGGVVVVVVAYGSGGGRRLMMMGRRGAGRGGRGEGSLLGHGWFVGSLVRPASFTTALDLGPGTWDLDLNRDLDLTDWPMVRPTDRPID
ncbi:hypothetical protein CHU98_g12577, partial [Xylaria longipes]